MNSKELMEQRKINGVAILGAGASAEAGAPVLSNFFNKVEDLIRESKFTPTEIETFKGILEKRKRLLPHSNIEEFLSYVDFRARFDVLIPQPENLRRLRNRHVSKKDKDCIPDLTNFIEYGKETTDFTRLRGDISFLISRTLHETLQNTDETIETCYRTLINNFKVIISFNWDILYETSYRNLKNNRITEENLGFKLKLRIPAILKMHGSLNWGVCPRCGIIISNTKIEHLIYEGMKCWGCNQENLVATSILPVLNKFERLSKNEDNLVGLPPYKNIWGHAMYALSNAADIYFFGYSLSDVDFHTILFLKGAIHENFNEKITMHIINNQGDIINRYNKIFEEQIRSGKIQIIHEKNNGQVLTFKEFLQSAKFSTT